VSRHTATAGLIALMLVCLCSGWVRTVAASGAADTSPDKAATTAATAVAAAAVAGSKT
jgi:hypothetical protein